MCVYYARKILVNVIEICEPRYNFIIDVQVTVLSDSRELALWLEISPSLIRFIWQGRSVCA
jgi:hypothetical protein